MLAQFREKELLVSTILVYFYVSQLANRVAIDGPYEVYQSSLNLKLNFELNQHSIATQVQLLLIFVWTQQVKILRKESYWYKGTGSVVAVDQVSDLKLTFKFQTNPISFIDFFLFVVCRTLRLATLLWFDSTKSTMPMYPQITMLWMRLRKWHESILIVILTLVMLLHLLV